MPDTPTTPQERPIEPSPAPVMTPPSVKTDGKPADKAAIKK